jgi:DNA modification methylase
MENNRIYNMDTIEGMKRLGDNTIDLILTDIPYDIPVISDVYSSRNNIILSEDNYIINSVFEMNFDLNAFLDQTLRLCRGSIYIFCSTEQISFIRKYYVDAGLTTRHLIWQKTNPPPQSCKYLWLSGIENIIFARKPYATFNSQYEHPVLRNSVRKGFEGRHPTEKPIKLFEKIIEISSKEGDRVLDPLIGSGTTAVACKKLNRKFIGFEINPDYVTMANSRLNNIGNNTMNDKIQFKFENNLQFRNNITIRIKTDDNNY